MLIITICAQARVDGIVTRLRAGRVLRKNGEADPKEQNLTKP